MCVLGNNQCAQLTSRGSAGVLRIKDAIELSIDYSPFSFSASSPSRGEEDRDACGALSRGQHIKSCFRHDLREGPCGALRKVPLQVPRETRDQLPNLASTPLTFRRDGYAIPSGEGLRGIAARIRRPVPASLREAVRGSSLVALLARS